MSIMKIVESYFISFIDDKTTDEISKTETTTQDSIYKKKGCKILNFIKRAKEITERSNKRVERCTDKFYLDEEPKDEMVMIKYHSIFMNCHSMYLKTLEIQLEIDHAQHYPFSTSKFISQQ